MATISGGEASGGSSGNGASASVGGQVAATLPPHAIVATAHGACALDAQGIIRCWGLARLGPEGWQIPEGSFDALFSDPDAVCAVRADQTVACFFEPIPEASNPDITPTARVRELALGPGVLCGIDQTGEAFCDWFDELVEPPVPTSERFRTISAGAWFACGIREADDGVLCWGLEDSGDDCDRVAGEGQLDAPQGGFQQISSSGYSSCAIRMDGSVACWGAGEPSDDPDALFCDDPLNFGQSGPPAGSFRSVSIGEDHACAIREDGTVACWGAGTGTIYECANGGHDCDQSVPPDGVFEQVAVGNLHTCAMRADRTVACWGWEGDGDGRTLPPPEFQ